MKKSIYLKIAVICIVPAIISNMIVGFVIMKTLQNRIEPESIEELIETVSAVRKSFETGEISEKAIEDIFSPKVIDLRVIDNIEAIKSSGIFDDNELTDLENKIENDYDKIVILKEEGSKKASSRLGIVVAKSENNYIVASPSYINKFIFGTQKHTKEVSIIITIIISMIMLVVVKLALRPIKELQKATEKMAKGDFSSRINIESEDEIGELVKRFNIMAQELGSVEILKKDFISDISHEFKTPLMAIQGYAKLLKSESTSNEQIEYIDIMIEETERLSKMSSNILLLNNMEDERFTFQCKVFRIDEQIRKVIMMYENLWNKKNIAFNLNLEKINFNGNEQLMYQVFSNLLGNAIKFSKLNDSIDIIAKEKDNIIDISIQDYGKGIKEEELKYIFDKFYKCDKSRQEEGNGLGLSIVKKIVDLHNGNITVSSQLGKGTEIKLKLDNS